MVTERRQRNGHGANARMATCCQEDKSFNLLQCQNAVVCILETTKQTKTQVLGLYILKLLFYLKKSVSMAGQ